MMTHHRSHTSSKKQTNSGPSNLDEGGPAMFAWFAGVTAIIGFVASRIIGGI